MEILGIGPLEFLLVVLLALILVGPKDLIQTGRKLGDGLRKLIRSDSWQTLRKTSNHIRDIPGRLIQETGLEEVKKATETIRGTVGPGDLFENWTLLGDNPKAKPPLTDNNILPSESDRRD